MFKPITTLLKIEREELLPLFEDFYAKHRQEFLPVRFYFVELIGKRTSFLCGEKAVIPQPLTKVQINDNFAICLLLPENNLQHKAEKIIDKLSEIITNASACHKDVNS